MRRRAYDADVSEVEAAFGELKKEYAGLVREANPLYGEKSSQND